MILRNSKKTTATPPAPQNRKRRIAFFLVSLSVLASSDTKQIAHMKAELIKLGHYA